MMEKRRVHLGERAGRECVCVGQGMSAYSRDERICVGGTFGIYVRREALVGKKEFCSWEEV